MGKPYMHAEVSAKRFGGKSEDYLAIHELMDSSKLAIADNRHRALTHNTWFIEMILKRVFGASIKNSDGKTVSVQDIGEQHCLDDFTHRFIPTAQDYLQEMNVMSWMSNRDGDVPSSAKKFKHPPVEVQSGRITPSRRLVPISVNTGIPNDYPLAIEPSLDRAYLKAIPGSLWDTEYQCRVGTDIQFFVRPKGEDFAYLCRKKTEADAFLWQSKLVDYPREFEANAVAVFVSDNLRDLAKYAHVSFEFENKRFTRPLLDFSGCDIKSAIERLGRTKIYGEDQRTRPFPDNELPSGTTTPLGDFSTRIKPGQEFSATLHWDNKVPIEHVGEKFDAVVALCGSHWMPM